MPLFFTKFSSPGADDELVSAATLEKLPLRGIVSVKTTFGWSLANETSSPEKSSSSAFEGRLIKIILKENW